MTDQLRVISKLRLGRRLGSRLRGYTDSKSRIALRYLLEL